jgi:hypothetical protein
MLSRTSRQAPGLVDTFVILLAAFTIVLMTLWIAGQVQGLDLFQTFPPVLSRLFSSTWSFLTTGASSLLLFALKSRLQAPARAPNYLAWIAGTAVFLMVSIVAASVIVRPAIQSGDFTLKFRVVVRGANHPPTNLSFLQKEPVYRPPHYISLQPSQMYEEKIDLPAKRRSSGGASSSFRFLAYANPVVWEANYSYPSSGFEICFVRSNMDPGRAPLEAWMDCDDASGCSISRSDPGWIELCPKPGNSPRTCLPSFVTTVFAADGSPNETDKLGWKIPSLETLRKKITDEKVGYIQFSITSGALPQVSGADSFTYAITVNGTPIYIDGWPPGYVRVPLDPSQGVSFSFGLENLDFCGAKQGFEQVTVIFEFHHQDQVLGRVTLTREYAAMWDAEAKELTTEFGGFRWQGTYVAPARENQYEIIIRSTSDVGEAQRTKTRIDNAALTFQNKAVIAVIRAPIKSPQFGVVLGLRQPNGQIQFTFDRYVAADLCRWVAEIRNAQGLGGLIRGDAVRYQFRPRIYTQCSQLRD